MDYSLEKNKLSQWWKPWRKSLSIQRQTLAALFFRETRTRFGEQSLGILWAFGEALTHLLFFWGLWTVLGRHAYNGMIIPVFLASGLLPFFFFKNCFTKVANSITGNQALLVFSQIQILDFALARFLVELTIYASAMTIFILMLFFVGFDIKVYSYFNIVSGFLLMGFLAIGLGLIYLPFQGKYKIIDTFVPMFLTFLYFLSGAIFPLENLPSTVYEYLSYNPIYHIINFIRLGFDIDFQNHEGMAYSIRLVLFSMMIGLILQKKLKRMILND